MTAPAIVRPAADEPAAAGWALVERAQLGDAQAFGKIYQQNAYKIFQFIYSRVSSRELAEDLTGDVFTKAWKNISRVTWQGRDIGAWLMTIARNLVVDYYKSARYRLEMLTGEILEVDQVDSDPGPEATAIASLTSRDLIAAVQKLGDEQRQCIILRFFNGCTIAETARAMGKTEAAIKAMQYRATGSLARLYKIPAEEA